MKNLWSKLDKKNAFIYIQMIIFQSALLHHFLLEDNDIQTLQHKQLIMALID